MKENNNAFAYISIVAIVAIVAVFVMFAGSGSKETSQPIVLDDNILGDAISILKQNHVESNTDICYEIYDNCITYGWSDCDEGLYACLNTR